MIVGAAVLFVGMVVALWLPAGRSSTIAADHEPDAEAAASGAAELVRA